MSNISKSVLSQCQIKLLETKSRLMGQLLEQREQLANREVGGDEADLGAHAIDESQLYIRNQRVREQLLEVEFALSRIERGTYGICEETQEPIEVERLLALPWTRLSIEGAELRENLSKKQSS